MKMLAHLSMYMKYKSSDPKTLAIEVHLFLQQMFAEYLPCSSVCYNDEQQEMVTPEWGGGASNTVKCEEEAQGPIGALGRDLNLPSQGVGRRNT